jgi:hypothetical protein
MLALQFTCSACDSNWHICGGNKGTNSRLALRIDVQVAAGLHRNADSASESCLSGRPRDFDHLAADAAAAASSQKQVYACDGATCSDLR